MVMDIQDRRLLTLHQIMVYSWAREFQIIHLQLIGLEDLFRDGQTHLPALSALRNFEATVLYMKKMG